MTLDAKALRNLLCERLCEDVVVDGRPDGELMLRTHFCFPDGDTFNHKADGASRKHPYRVRGRWHLIGAKPALLVFCPASPTPLGSISTAQKRELGAIVAKMNRPT